MEEVLISPDRVPSTVVGLLVAYPGEPAETIVPVVVYPNPAVPPGALVTSEDLMKKIGLWGVTHPHWVLRFSGFDNSYAQEVCLEIASDESLDQATRVLASSSELSGRMVYLPANASVTGQLLEIESIPFRIRSLSPTPVRDSVFVIDASHTRASLFASSQRVGVDIVILADCSGSMSIADLSEIVEGESAAQSLLQRFASALNSTQVRYVPRIHVLRRALLDLVDRRLRLSGSSSRIALVGFGTSSRLLFPYQEGMLQLDQATPIESLRRFRDIIATLQADMGGTRIGLAISFAASHLSRYGNPANERLIVLLSDGADWTPAKADQTGEILEQVSEEPVSLMEHLHETMGIHIQAIGISNDRVYDEYLRRSGKTDVNVGNRPNHALLERLVAVGGGDPARTGDAQVIEEYFQTLAAGVTRQISYPASRKGPPQLNPDERARMIRESTSDRVPATETVVVEDAEITALARELESLYAEANRRTLSLVGQRLFNPSPEASTELFRDRISLATTSSSAFKLFISSFWSVFDDSLIPSVRQRAGNPPPPLDEIRSFLYSSRFNEVQVLRNFIFHDGLRGDDAGERALRAGEILARHTGQRSLGDDDAGGWCRLQKGLISTVRDVVKAVVAKLEAFERTHTGPPPGEDLIVRGW
ncbi:MAG TPA: vWA domain-containing protein [Bryobacteraceae bacterium]|nr:vWA domain-containing protein [Bryobacteraceae bacterium]